MPRYDFRCPAHGVFEADGRRDERQIECACGLPATRLPFSGVPYLKGDTVPRQIPDPAYRQEAEKRQLNATWGDASRSVEMLRKNSFVDNNGIRQIDMKALRADG